MMRDANGREMKTGDIVRVSGAYFKKDNGLYFVAHSPGDVSWSGSDYSLRKIRKNGELTASNGDIVFWPLESFVNDREKRALAYDWNKANAKIEVVDGVDNGHIKDHFIKEAANAKVSADRLRWDWGRHSANYLLPFRIYKFYTAVANSL